MFCNIYCVYTISKCSQKTPCVIVTSSNSASLTALFYSKGKIKLPNRLLNFYSLLNLIWENLFTCSPSNKNTPSQCNFLNVQTSTSKDFFTPLGKYDCCSRAYIIQKHQVNHPRQPLGIFLHYTPVKASGHYW